MPSGYHVLNAVTWTTFMVGLVTITLAYLSATFAGGQGLVGSKNLRAASTVGTALMYAALLLMPAVPLVHHHEQKDLNKYDWGAAAAQWFSYVLLPVALYLWDRPQQARTGAVVLAVSLASLLGSIVLQHQAHKTRHPNSPTVSLRLLR